MPKNAITTIKIQKETKERLEKLREHKRESYDEIVQKALGILSICMTSPIRAQAKLRIMERQKRVKQSLNKKEGKR